MEKICQALGIPLVLHGGSGTQPEHIRKAVALGMAKINVASELCRSHRGASVENMKHGKAGWVPSMLAAARPRMAQVVPK